MLDATKKPAFYIVGAGIIGITGCTMVMNGIYFRSQGHIELEKNVLMVGGLCMDLVKIFGLGFVVQAAIKRSYFKALIGGLIWSVCVLSGLVAANGFALMTRSYITAEQSDANEKLAKVKKKYDDKLADLTTLKAELDAMKNNERYLRTAGCSVPEPRMTVESRYFCTKLSTHKDKIKEAELQVYLAEKEVPKDQTSKPVDPQMTFYASMFQVPIQTLVQYWALGIAIAFELVSSFGMFSMSPTRRKFVRTGEVVDEDDLDQPAKRGPGRPKGSKNKPKLAVVDGHNVNATDAA